MSHHSEVRLDFNYMLADQLDSEHGLSIDEIESLFPSTTQIQQAMHDLRKLGQLPFQELPYHAEEAQQIQSAADEVMADCENVVVLGIGGSGLGPACLYQFLRTAPTPSASDAPAEPTKRLFVIDNVDPVTWQKIEASLAIEKTLFIVISKSGKTVETLAAFAYFRGKLIQKLGKSGYQKNLAIITDPHGGPLRDIVTQEDILSFTVPAAVGGRYSVMSPVGLFPAACVGFDIEALLSGARLMDERANSTDLWSNPPYLTAILSYLSATKKGKAIRVLMPYAESLETYTEWYAQLWAESLGKRTNLSGEEIHAGTTPVRAMGATDQHSQLQLYLEGPRDKAITFYTVDEVAPLEIPESYSQYEEFKSIAGKSVHELLRIEYRATERALRNHGIPSMTIKLPQLNASALGQLFYLAELETVATGELYNVNPFDQPAVESVKKYIKALLGIPGFEKELEDIEGSGKEKRYVI